MPGPWSSRFRIGLLVILVVAGAVRTTFIVAVARHDHTFYDAAYYELQARQIAKGHGYTDPFEFLPGAPHRSRPAADHPPLTVFAILPVIAAGDAIGLAESTHAARGAVPDAAHRPGRHRAHGVAGAPPGG